MIENRQNVENNIMLLFFKEKNELDYTKEIIRPNDYNQLQNEVKKYFNEDDYFIYCRNPSNKDKLLALNNTNFKSNIKQYIIKKKFSSDYEQLQNDLNSEESENFRNEYCCGICYEPSNDIHYHCLKCKFLICNKCYKKVKKCPICKIEVEKFDEFKNNQKEVVKKYQEIINKKSIFKCQEEEEKREKEKKILILKKNNLNGMNVDNIQSIDNMSNFTDIINNQENNNSEENIKKEINENKEVDEENRKKEINENKEKREINEKEEKNNAINNIINFIFLLSKNINILFILTVLISLIMIALFIITFYNDSKVDLLNIIIENKIKIIQDYFFIESTQNKLYIGIKNMSKEYMKDYIPKLSNEYSIIDSALNQQKTINFNLIDNVKTLEVQNQNLSEINYSNLIMNDEEYNEIMKKVQIQYNLINELKNFSSNIIINKLKNLSLVLNNQIDKVEAIRKRHANSVNNISYILKELKIIEKKAKKK